MVMSFKEHWELHFEMHKLVTSGKDTHFSFWLNTKHCFGYSKNTDKI